MSITSQLEILAPDFLSCGNWTDTFILQRKHWSTLMEYTWASNNDSTNLQNKIFSFNKRIISPCNRFQVETLWAKEIDTIFCVSARLGNQPLQFDLVGFVIDRPFLQFDPIDNSLNWSNFSARAWLIKENSPGWLTSWRYYFNNSEIIHPFVDYEHYWSALLREIAVKPSDYNHNRKGELF